MIDDHLDSKTRALLQLTLIPGLGPKRLFTLLKTFTEPRSILDATASSLRQVHGIGRDTADQIVSGRQKSLESLQREIELINQYDAKLISILDDEYPKLLRMIDDPPCILYVQGNLQLCIREPSVAIVGSRRCSAYGRDQAGRLSAGLAQAGLTIVSGGARGIDSEAHRGALRVNGKTIAVLGSGLAKVYPPENEDLFTEIAEHEGAVVSELAMETGPTAKNFPRRNRIISGLSLGTLVIEASERSGALITARLACEDHNRTLMILPGRVDSPTSTGCLRILRQGWGELVRDVADILEALDAGGVNFLLDATIPQLGETSSTSSLFDNKITAADTTTKQKQTAEHPLTLAGLTESQRKIYEALDGEPVELDELSARTGLDISRLQADVTMLQIRGLIARKTTAGISLSRG